MFCIDLSMGSSAPPCYSYILCSKNVTVQYRNRSLFTIKKLAELISCQIRGEKRKKKLTTMYEYIYLPVCYMIYPCFGHTGGKTEKAGPRFESSQILVMMNDGNFYRTCRKIRERERERES